MWVRRLDIPLLGLLFLGSSLAPAASESRQLGVGECFELPALFEWQALDDRNLVVWAHPEEQLFEVTLAEPIDGLTATSDRSLEFVDGDHDGYICSEGFDDVVLDGKPQDSSGPAVMLGEAEVYLVGRLNDLALKQRLDLYAATHGPKQFGDLDE